MKTGVVYDHRMALYSCLWDDTYVENPERFLYVVRRCEELGLLERCQRLESRLSTREELRMCHDEKLLDLLESTSGMDLEQLKEVSSAYDCLYIHNNSWEAAQLSAGGAIDLVTAVVQGRVENGMAIVRPPGHHAMRADSCGYCYVNNVALAARTALNMGLERVLVVDWDVHHGQGTLREFYSDNQVMYISIHRFEYGGWWPNLRESDYDNIGEGAGAGYNVNIPLNRTGNTDSDYLAAWHSLVLPVATQFDPQLVIISAGFDPAIGCPEGEQEVTPACFAHFTHSLQGLAGGSVCAMLEGGYFPPSLAEGAALTLRTLLGDPCPYLPYPIQPANKEMLTAIKNVQIALSPYWSTFSQHRHESVHPTIWEGPEEPDKPPFDIMCPTPPRPVEEEERLIELVKELVRSTNLSMAEVRLAVTAKIGYEMEGVTLTDDAAELVVMKHSTAAIVDSVTMVKKSTEMKNLKTLVVTYNRNGTKEAETTFNDDNLCISIKRSNEQFAVTANTEEIMVITDSLAQVTNKVLLPVAYKFSPQAVVVMFDTFPVSSPTSIKGLYYMIHQMRTLAEGRIIVVTGTKGEMIKKLVKCLK